MHGANGLSLLIIYWNIILYECFMGVSRLHGPIDACACSGYQVLVPRREGPGDEARILRRNL